MANGGQIIAAVLQEYGIEQLFTLSGGHIAPVYVEAERAGMRIVDVRDEASAVFGADALARLTGRPGVAVVTAGPGVTNAITALKNAQMAQSPVVLLGGATATLLRGRGALQDIDQLSLVRSTVKGAYRIGRLSELAPVLRKALRLSQSGVPGPVFIEIPVDLLYPEATVREWYAQAGGSGKSFRGKLLNWYMQRHLNRIFYDAGGKQRGTPAAPAVPDFNKSDLEAARKALRQAKRPVLVISSGALMLAGEVPRLAEAVGRLGVPVFLSGMARGLLGRMHPLQYRHHRSRALREADCIILAGVPCDFRLNYGRSLNRKAFRIAVSRHRGELRKNIRPDYAIHADPGRFLTALATLATDLPSWAGWKTTLDERETAREQEIDAMARQDARDINPVALFRQLEDALPDNSIIVVDGGDFAATAAYTLRPRRPLGWLDPGVFGTLGVGGGFALGAALHYPDHYIWIIYGDGSAAYSLMEFDTFRKNNMRVCAIIGNNGSWEQIARDQVPMLGTATATTLPQSDYQQIAQSFGGEGVRINDPGDFPKALYQALESMDRGIPFLINAVIGSTGFREGSISM